MNQLAVISLAINVILIVISVGLAVYSWRADKKSKSQVKIWMQQSNGISQALRGIVRDKWDGLYSSVDDIANAVSAVEFSVFALYQSLYEERVLTEKEYRNEQLTYRKKLNDRLDKEEQQQRPSAESDDNKSISDNGS